ncbi:hypothetical protein [Haloferula sp.]|uniref:hypothetical protein n=1 Tax=Haloferula sp. TaxID=2497595 RepID=UPI00329D6720
MKNALTLPILSGVALAIMAGAAISHHHSVDNMVAFAGMTRANGMPSLSTGPARIVSNESDAKMMVEELKRQNDSLQQTLATNVAAISAAPKQASAQPISGSSNEMQQLLTELVTQNRYLRDQISETNRDVMTLQFQVDSHSTQFRPLNLTDDSAEEPFENDYIGVLPPSDLP